MDSTLGPQLHELGVKGIERAARRMATELDAAAIVARREAAVASRRVSVRPAPDGMAYLTVLAPMKEAVAAYGELHHHAGSVSAGTAWRTDATGEQTRELPEGRGRGAIMADAAIARLTGRAVAEPAPVEVQLVMTDRALLGTGDPARSEDEPAWMPGHGPVPASTARAWIRDEKATVWLRRLYTGPTGRDLVGMDSR